MLKITIIDGPAEQKFVLEGKLMAPGIAELESAWEGACSARGARECVVDLRNATFIDQNGEKMLLRMKRDGAQFIACGVCTTYQLEALGIKCQSGAAKSRG